MDKKHRRRIVLLIVGLLIVGLIFLCITILCIKVNTFLSSPEAECYDVYSGHAPKIALETFIERVVSATLVEDYEWIEVVSNKSIADDLRQLRPIMSDRYRIRYSDNTAGLYEYYVHFENGTVIYFGLFSIWPECPDNEVTEDEIFENIELKSVKDATEHYQDENP